MLGNVESVTGNEDPTSAVEAVVISHVLFSLRVKLWTSAERKLQALEEDLGRELPALREKLRDMFDLEATPAHTPALPAASGQSLSTPQPPEPERRKPGRPRKHNPADPTQQAGDDLLS
jgi:hypothetical protein